MPNLAPPVISVAAAEAYRTRILAALPDGERLHPADDLLSRSITRRARGDRARLRRRRVGGGQALSRPRDHQFGATASPTSRTLAPALEAMQRIGMPLLVHGEVTDPEVDVFDREAVFIERVLAAAGPRLPGAEDRLRAYHHRRGGGLRRGRRAERRRDRHAASSRHQPQRDVRRRPAPACLLPAGGEARAAPAGGAPRRRSRARRNSSSAPTAPRMRVERQGGGLRLRRHLQRARSRSKPMRRCSRRKARSTGWRPSPSENGPRFYGLPLNEGTVVLERAPVTVPDGRMSVPAGRRWRGAVTVL